jgi:hypothetical protein
MNKRLSNEPAPGVYTDSGPWNQLLSSEAQLVTFSQGYFRDLVGEGRLDWDGFDLEISRATQGQEESREPHGQPALSLDPRPDGIELGGHGASRRRQRGRSWRRSR